MWVEAAYTIDFLHLAGGEFFLRIETPSAFE